MWKAVVLGSRAACQRTSPVLRSNADDRAFGLAVRDDIDEVIDDDRRFAEAMPLFEGADVCVATLRRPRDVNAASDDFGRL